MDAPTQADFIEQGTPAFTRTNLALFSAGFSTFGLMYCVQPLMPELARDFAVAPVAASLSLSVTTGVLAFCILFASIASEAWGRKPVMTAALFASAGLTLAASLSPSWPALLVARALMGITLSGLPATAMAYVGEEMHPRSVGLAMGLYVGGSGLGGMAGRLLTGVLTDLGGWRWAMAAMGLCGLAAALAFWAMLPPSRHFTRQTPRLGAIAAGFAVHLRDAALPLLFAEAFLVMGAFVTVYNYIGFRLLAPPFALSPSAVGLLFSVYIVGVFSSAWVGNLAGRLGRRRVFPATIALMLAGIGATLAGGLPMVILGMALVTFGFFGTHSIASAWVGRRATRSKAQASALYLFAYYLGSSVAGSAGGLAWGAFGWAGVCAFTGLLLAAALALAARLAGIAPLAHSSAAA